MHTLNRTIYAFWGQTNMATKASAILIALFLLTLPVRAGRATGCPPAAPIKAAQVLDEATPEATATAEATETGTLTGTGDPLRGQQLFQHGLNDAPACINCHNPAAAGKSGFAIGPGLLGIRERAATRIEGVNAAAYIEDSIRNPGDYVVSGFSAIMYGLFAEKYSDQDIADVVAYLMTL